MCSKKFGRCANDVGHGAVDARVDLFVLERLHAALGMRIIVWISGPRHREAKPSLLSAAAWDRGVLDAEPLGAELLQHAARAPDPCLRFERGWMIRRLAPDCSRVSLIALPSPDDQRELLHAMGGELANLHLGHPSARTLGTAQASWSSRDLLTGARAMRAVVDADWAEFCDTVPHRARKSSSSSAPSV